jgi:hypothetical protein
MATTLDWNGRGPVAVISSLLEEVPRRQNLEGQSQLGLFVSTHLVHTNYLHKFLFPSRLTSLAMASEQYVSVTTMPPNKRFQYNMIQVHKILKMGYDIIVSHLDNPPTDDLANFLGYCQSWADTIDNHHNSEGAFPSSVTEPGPRD